jgi:catechol 2,3-dioxygenase-like lactoylglutathione lyase family enzyme
MIKPAGLIAGHYECRALDETLPVLTDLLAMQVVERRSDQARLKHPNTAWQLIVHEGGADAPEKTFDNHYGFRVASHVDVDAAWQYIDAHKEKYRITKLTKPQKAHFAYSIYFHEPGGNHLEIEYYNPGGALHGRNHTAGHWQQPLTAEQFPGRGYLPQALTHGTLQCDNLAKTKEFLIDTLGLEHVGGMSDRTIYVKHSATPWYIVMLPRSPRQYLGPANRFTLQLESADAVEHAHRDFTANRQNLGLTGIDVLQTTDGRRNFLFSDLDKNWWELTS